MKNILKLLRKNQQGFTLIELLVVIAIVAALAVTVFVALNPAQRLKDARDARRLTDAESILTAVHQYITDNKGVTTALALTTTDAQLGTGLAAACSPVTTGGCAVAASTACKDLTTPLAKYLKSMPTDPLTGTAASTGYTINMDANGIVTIKACLTGTGTAEGTVNISVSR
ncbi:MAG: type II secretion system GspH family protein [bacterium]|nr:type II secretion system GspH family protein [bacterium]